MSQLLYKTRCPACAEKGKDRSGDNLGVYDDGHSYCWSCGYFSGGTLSDRIKTPTGKANKVIPTLPEDITTELGKEANEWLSQYFDSGNFPKCFWSVSERKLYFMFPEGQYQYRYFGDNKDHPKWVGYGINESLIHICSSNGVGNNSSLCLVEDIISALKVGHITPTMCLFGSNISLKRLATLKQLGYTNVTIWLDWDKRDYAIEAAKRAQSIGIKARVIHTQLDPKEYDYDSIRGYLSKSS